MSTSNSRYAELMKRKFDEVQGIMMEQETEMGNLVKFHHVLKKEIDTLESSKNLEKCSLEEKLQRSQMRCEELEKRFTQKEEENAKLLCQKWDAEAKLEKSVRECEELRSEKFHAYQRMEEMNEKLNHEKLDVEEKLGRSDRKCKELMSENVDANQRMEELQRKNVEAVEELRLKKMESDKAAQLYKSRFDDLELKMMSVRTKAQVLNANLANLVGSMDKTAAAASDLDFPDSVESGQVNAAAGDRYAVSAEVRVTGGDSGGIGLSKKGAICGINLVRRCDLRIISKIKKNLAKENIEMFEQSCFGHLLKMDQLHYQGQLMLMLLLHIDMGASNKERLVFKINNSNIEFGYDDFCRITGLRFGTSEATARYSCIQANVFQGRSSIRLNDVEEAFLKVSRDHDGRGELTLKLALLYFLYGTLLARNPIIYRSDLQYLHLIDDLHKFSAFPWGRVAYEFLVSSILWVRDHMDDKESNYKRKNIEMHGFIFALQVWAYEVMPSVATYCASRADNFNNLRPHILRWTPATNIIQFNHLKKFFAGGDQSHLVEKRERGVKGLQRCSSFAGEDVIFICDSDDEIPDSPPKTNVAGFPVNWNRKRKRSTYGFIKSEETAVVAAAQEFNDEDLSGLQS